MTVVDAPLATGEAVTSGDDLPFDPGTEVEVRNRFDGRWARGFEIIAVEAPGYRVRRLSDGRELPSTFGLHDVRLRERKRGTWWY
ncbi:MAG TPA: hypothetical protein VIJ47_00195 [Acidimicrobiales bacterium]